MDTQTEKWSQKLPFITLYLSILLHQYIIYFIQYIFPSLMQQKFIVTLLLYSRHISAIHGHLQVSVGMLCCRSVLHVTTACV
jgi:hypothetical protein